MMTNEAVASMIKAHLDLHIETAERLGGGVTFNLAFCKNLAALAEDYLKLSAKCERLKEEKDGLQTALDRRDADAFEALSVKLYNGEIKDPRGVMFTPEFKRDLDAYLKMRREREGGER